MDQKQFLALLSGAVQHKVSDIHLQAGFPPAFRIRGDMVNVKHPPLSEQDFELILRVLGNGSTIDPLKTQELDGSFEVKGLSRFRFNLYKMKGKLAAVLRLIPSSIPTIEELGYPPVLKKIAESPRGLVLVTGATGSGKSTTLASMINHINSTQPLHILTIEDPVEFVHPNKKSRISQREVGPDTKSYANALKAALRQDPDVILVGEMRDAETIDIALKAAETGHLVFSTVHTTDAVRTIGRLVCVFPPEEQWMVRQRLADNLISTISQRLVKRKGGNSLVAVQEIMISNMGIAQCIANPEKTTAIKDLIQKSSDVTSGQTFDQHLVDLYKSGAIDMETAKEASSNASDFERNLKYSSAEGGTKTTSSLKRGAESHQESSPAHGVEEQMPELPEEKVMLEVVQPIQQQTPKPSTPPAPPVATQASLEPELPVLEVVKKAA